MIKDYYRVLGLTNDAEDVVIRAAFKLLAQKYHPDKWSKEEQETANRIMKKINEAHDTLSDPVCKAEYDLRQNAFEADYYRVLGVLDNADDHLIHAAYKALSQKYRNLPRNAFCKNRLYEINEAYQVLADATNRRIYDLQKKRSRLIFQKRSMVKFSLWRIYLTYVLEFYLVMALIFAIIIWTH